MNDTLKELTTADLYEGAYGLTLYLDISSDYHLNKLRALFLQLANGSVTQLALAKETGFLLTGVGSIQLVCTADEDEKKTVFLLKQNATRHLEWKATQDQWQFYIELLQGFTAGEPAHQYLSEEGVDDVLIKVAYLESVSCWGNPF